MPELPEVERVRVCLEGALGGRRVRSARVARRDVVRTNGTGRGRLAALLVGGEVVGVRRHGKQLGIVAGDGRAICVHLGMSGQLYHLPRGVRMDRRDHVHVVWRLDDGSRVVYRDVRRFGGIWTFSSAEEGLAERWGRLGADALTIRTRELAERLGATRRAVKAALLDQRVLAGVGNIYADEACFRAGVVPGRPAAGLEREEAGRLAGAIRATLREAIRGRGSSIRDYLDGLGRAGGFQRSLRVYGRGGEACVSCGGRLSRGRVAQRMTVWCARCQA